MSPTRRARTKRRLVWFLGHLALPLFFIVGAPLVAGAFVYEHNRADKLVEVIRQDARYLRDQLVAQCERGNDVRFRLTVLHDNIAVVLEQAYVNTRQLAQRDGKISAEERMRLASSKRALDGFEALAGIPQADCQHAILPVR